MSSRNVKKFALCMMFVSALLVSNAWAQGAVRTIQSFSDLRKIGAEYPLDGTYELSGVIVASGGLFEPIGPTRDNAFTGKFYGKGGLPAVIRGLRVDKASGHAGLFGVIGAGGEVSNIVVEDADVAGAYAVGALAGTNYGTVTACYSTGAVRAFRGESNVGGLVGVNGGTVAESYSSVSVDGHENVGGLIGLLTSAPGTGKVFRSYAVGPVTGTKRVGGLVGHVFGGSVEECYATGKVSGNGAAGGLIGEDFVIATASPTVRGINSGGNYVATVAVGRSYWDEAATEQSASAGGGAGKNTEEMMDRETFEGWDFTDAGNWAAPNLADMAYPRLKPAVPKILNYVTGNEDGGRLTITLADGTQMQVYGGGVPTDWGVADFTVEAKPWPGYVFVGWSDGSTDPVRSGDVQSSDATFVAIFEPETGIGTERSMMYYMSANGGMMWGDGGDKAVDTYGDRFPEGSKGPTVAAVPLANFRFSGWNDGNTGLVRSTDIVTDAAAVFTASFAWRGSNVIAISNFDELNKIGNDEGHPLNANYRLKDDIDASSGNFNPIGTADAPFTGAFYGNGHTISGLNIVHQDFAGLFGYARNAVITGVYLDAVSVRGESNVGALVGYGENMFIDSCGVSGSVRGSGGTVGGLAGKVSTSLISRSYSLASVNGADRNIGGLVGVSEGSMITQCYAAGNVEEGTTSIGGLAGIVDGGRVQYAYATGNVSGSKSGVGGLIGDIAGGARIFHCYSTGLVSGAKAGTGGLIGVLEGDGGRTYSCYWDVERSKQVSSSGGTGKTTYQMLVPGTYAGWNFNEIWATAGSTPYLQGLVPFENWVGAAQPKSKGALAHARTAAKPQVRVSGRSLIVKAPSTMTLQIRLLDMKGRTAARYNVTGDAKVSLDKISSGRYIVDMRENGKMVNVSRVRIYK